MPSLKYLKLNHFVVNNGRYVIAGTVTYYFNDTIKMAKK
jgi:hypothetical protein